MKKVLFSFLLLVLCVFVSGCASKPAFKGNGDLCGLIIDENNKSVKDFIVYCHSADAKPFYARPVITNENGLFVFNDIPSGRYQISGEKNNYLKINKVPYSFDDRSKILCLQTKKFKSAVLSAEKMIRLGQLAEADAMLNEISCESKSFEESLITAFRYFTNEKERKKKSLVAQLKKYKGNESEFFREYAEKLEEACK